ncbi:hypothetical protein [Meiothermus cerbereus]|uniref:hypothetical protein n=1 Tax=Meiothermus cerbereus TaxID=65552 RepID=UPI003EEF5296
MNDKRLNLPRVAILLAIAIYFGFLFLQPKPGLQPSNTSASVAQPGLTASSSPPCAAQIEQVGLSLNEVRLRLRGAAERIVIFTEAGSVVASTVESGSAGEYRVRTPGAATAIQIDGCPVLNLR